MWCVCSIVHLLLHVSIFVYSPYHASRKHKHLLSSYCINVFSSWKLFIHQMIVKSLAQPSKYNNVLLLYKSFCCIVDRAIWKNTTHAPHIKKHCVKECKVVKHYVLRIIYRGAFFPKWKVCHWFLHQLTVHIVLIYNKWTIADAVPKVAYTDKDGFYFINTSL